MWIRGVFILLYPVGKRLIFRLIRYSKSAALFRRRAAASFHELIVAKEAYLFQEGSNGFVEAKGPDMILSQKKIEEIAAAVTKDFNEFFFV
jgi:hypothetical protein